MKAGDTVFLTTDEGVQKELIAEGSGSDTPETGDKVFVHYTGTLAADGSKFDSSLDRGQPLDFTLGQGAVIKGWDLAVATMKKGEKAMLTLKPEYAYGASGSGGTIPPNATLKFEVELVSWKSTKDILGNGGIIKSVATKGTGYKKPKDFDEVSVVYKVALVDGTVLKETAAPVEFVMKEGHLCSGLVKALEFMTLGEEAKCKMSNEYIAGIEGVPENVETLNVDVTLLSFKSVEDITGDGSVLKKILVEGSGYETPDECTKVKAKLTARLEDGTVFENKTSDEDLVEWTIDNDEVVPGLDLALRKMKKSETALITIKPEQAFGSVAVEKSLATVPANSTVVYEVELVSFDAEKSTYAMSAAEKLESAEAKKADGNALFKIGKLSKALKRYTKGISALDSDHDFSTEQKTQAKTLKIALQVNQAAVNLKLKDYTAVKECCSKALELESQNIKALFRRAQAFVALGDIDDAEKDLKKIIEIDPQNRDARAEFKKVKAAQKEAFKKESKIYGNMFSRMQEKGDLYSLPLAAEKQAEEDEDDTGDSGGDDRVSMDKLHMEEIPDIDHS